MLIALRSRIEAGEEGPDVDWWPWYKAKFPERSRKDAEKCMAVAKAEDPDAAEVAAREKMCLSPDCLSKPRITPPGLAGFLFAPGPGMFPYGAYE
jgi:hypothetical protein